MSMNITFSLTAEQVKKYEEWKVLHGRAYTGAIGGRYSFEFTPTGLGVIAKVKDPITGTEVDLTNYENW